jgi:thiol-disulfide isomerase/thioredoxin
MNKDIIDVTTYNNSFLKKTIIAYTGLWCGPCTRIKPFVNDYITKNEFKIISEETMSKTIFKKDINEYVPFFRVKDDITGTIVSIQTSDFNLLEKFLENQMAQDNDF